LKSVETRPATRLKVGIAGDIYTRINQVANHNLFLKLEEMGRRHGYTITGRSAPS
jgi:predicted nucleotide-binding protein (sugar kinase/HSP70/actin superfamily)